MQITIISEPLIDPTSELETPRWIAHVRLHTTKKAFEDELVWTGELTYETFEEAEQVGYERVAIGLFQGMK